MLFMLFSLADLGSFISGAGKTVADTVNSIKMEVPYTALQQPNQVRPIATAGTGGILSGTGGLLIIGLAAYLILRR